MLKTSWVTNPFYIYILSFLIVFFVYSFEWSTAFPRISMSTKIFFGITFIISCILGYPLKKYYENIRLIIPESKKNKICLIFFAIGYSVEFIYNGGIPLYLIIRNIPYQYTTFGIPSLHVFLHTFISFYSVYLFHQFLSNRKKNVLFLYLLTLIPHILIVNRGSLFIVLVSSLFVFLLSIKTLRIKYLFFISLFILVFFYFFGYLGNIRSANGDKYYIPKESLASKSFIDGPIPKEYFWGYAYIASPMANFQHNVNTATPQPSLKSGICLYKNELLPDFISKRLPEIECGNGVNRVFPFYNVSTLYAPSYSLMGWFGPIILFIYGCFIALFYTFTISRKSIYYVTGLAILMTTFLHNTFTNMWSFSGLSFQLIYPLIGYLFEGKRFIIKS